MAGASESLRIPLHEAGHAIVSAIRGFIIKKVFVDRTRIHAGGVPCDFPGPNRYDDPSEEVRQDAARNCIAVYAAGKIAESLLFEPKHEWSEFDESQIKAHAVQGILSPQDRDARLKECGGDIDKLFEETQGAEALVAQGRKMAEDIIRDHKSQLIELARHLERSGMVPPPVIYRLLGMEGPK